MKSGTSITTNGPGDSTTNNTVGPDASSWEMMNWTLEAIATRNTDSSERVKIQENLQEAKRI